MSGNVCGITPMFGYNPAAGVYNDFDKIDLVTGTTSFPMFGTGSSIFGGCPPMSPMIGIGAGGYDPSTYFDYMKQYQQYNNQYNIDQQKLNRNANLQINAPMESIDDTAVALRDKIMRNEQGQVMDAYKKYVESVRHAYGTGTEEEVNSRAIALYERLTGKSLMEDLREHGHGSFLQGLIQSFTLSTYARRSAEDNIADITGQQVPTGEKVAQNTGRIIGGGVIGAGVYKLLKTLTTAGSKLNGKAGMIGLITGAVVTALTFLTGKATTRPDK